MKRLPTIFGVNLLYLIMMILLLVVGAVAPLPLGWRIVVNELALILLPLAIYTALTKLDVKASFRLHTARWPVVGLAFAAGIGFYLFDRWLSLLVTALTDYTMPLTPELLDVSAFNAVLLMLGTGILAPIVEELFFRGVMFSAYESRGAALAVTGTALLFALFHMDPIQSLGLLPLVFALSFVAWRSGSIFPSMAMHFGNNLLAAVLVGLGTFLPNFTEPTVTMPVALIGLAVAALAVWGVTRLTAPEPAPARPQPTHMLIRILPMVVAVPMALLLILIGLLIGLFPQMLSFGMTLSLPEAPWQTAETWHYDILNAGDEPVGEATCTLTPEAETVLLECDAHQDAYEVTVGNSYFSDRAVDQSQEIRWDRNTLNIVEGQITAALFDDSRVEILLEQSGDELTVRTILDGEVIDETTQPHDALIEEGGLPTPLLIGEWPWRLSAMPMEAAYSRTVTLVWPFASPENNDEWQIDSETTSLIVRTADVFPASTGDVITWRVTVGDNYTAWYSVDEPHTLIAYDDGMVTWVLRDEP